MVPLDKTIKRVIKIKDVDYVVTLTPEAIKISLKGHRLGVELAWSDLVSGESALAVALHASVGRFSADSPAAAKAKAKRAAKPAAKPKIAPWPKTAPRPKTAPEAKARAGASVKIK